jgi:hypothetical protein
MCDANPVYLDMTITLVKPSDPGNKENKENKTECNASRCSPTPKVLFLVV